MFPCDVVNSDAMPRLYTHSRRYQTISLCVVTLYTYFGFQVMILGAAADHTYTGCIGFNASVSQGIRTEGVWGMGDLSVLPNIGPKIEAQLLEVGITTPAELIDVGSKEVWLRIKAIDDSACINRLYALEGAIQGIPDCSLSPDEKSELKKFYNENK